MKVLLPPWQYNLEFGESESIEDAMTKDEVVDSIYEHFKKALYETHKLTGDELNMAAVAKMLWETRYLDVSDMEVSELESVCRRIKEKIDFYPPEDYLTFVEVFGDEIYDSLVSTWMRYFNK